MSALVAHGVFGLAWLSFGLGHSLLADRVEESGLQRWFGPYYRLSFNLFAMAHLALVLGVGEWALAGTAVYVRPGWLEGAQAAALAAGAAILVLGLRCYDLSRFMGVRQILDHRRGVSSTDHEGLHVSGLHCYVRHPLYAGAFLILWGKVGNEHDLATALWASGYFLVGTVFEERRLLGLHGEAYARYRARVPAFVPWKGRVSWPPSASST